MSFNNPRIDLNPSSADRWTTCTASPQFIFDNWDKLPPRDNACNMAGTTAHEVAAALLQNRKPNPKECPVPITSEMNRHAWEYMEYVESLATDGCRIFIEQKFPLWYMPSRKAKIDVAIYHTQSLDIIDLKYGEGVVVSPIQNIQCAIYARATVENRYGKNPPIARDFPIRVHIYQPRGRGAEDAPFHVWESTWIEILEFTETHVAAPAKEILIGGLFPQNGLKFAPSEKACQWCPFKNPTPSGFFCGARRAAMTIDIAPLVSLENGPGHLMPVNALSVKTLSAILKYRGAIKKWLDEADAYALQFMKGGGNIEGFKLVMSRGGNRAWVNPQMAAKLLLETHLRREEVFEETVISVKQAEDLLGKNKFSIALTNLITKPPGQPTIAPADDTRKEAQNAASLFDNISKTDNFF